MSLFASLLAYFPSQFTLSISVSSSLFFLINPLPSLILHLLILFLLLLYFLLSLSSTFFTPTNPPCFSYTFFLLPTIYFSPWFSFSFCRHYLFFSSFFNSSFFLLHPFTNRCHSYLSMIVRLSYSLSVCSYFLLSFCFSLFLSISFTSYLPPLFINLHFYIFFFSVKRKSFSHYFLNIPSQFYVILKVHFRRRQKSLKNILLILKGALLVFKKPELSGK